jgi:putative cytotoxic protein
MHGRIYEYDGEHGGELEVYNKRGRHIGVADVYTGDFIKAAVRGRSIDV